MADKIIPKYDSEEDIPEGLRPFYDESEEGFVFNGIDDSESKSKVKEFRNTNISLRKELEQEREQFETYKHRFEGIDPENYTRAMSALEKIDSSEEKDLIKDGKIDEVVTKRTQVAIENMNQQLAAKDEAIRERDERAKTLQERLGTLLIDQDLQISVSKTGAKIKDGALEDLLRRGQSIWNIDVEGKRKAFDPRSREPLYGKTGDDLTMDEFAESLITQAPYFFEAGTGGGADAGVRSGKSKERTVDPTDPHAFSQNLEDLASGKKKIFRD